MKTSLVRCAVVLTMTVSMMTSVVLAKDGPTTARVTRLSGSTRYSTDNGSTWQALTKGMTVNPGTVIQTAAGAYVDVLLGAPAIAGGSDPVPGSLVYFPGVGSEQANIVRINESSTLSIDKLTVNRTGADVVSDTQLDLRGGSIYFSVKKLSAASKFEIKFPTGVAGVRGSFGYLQSTGLARMLLGALFESFVLNDGTPRIQIIQALQMFDPRTLVLTQLPAELRTTLQQEAAQILINLGGGNPLSTYLPNFGSFYCSSILGNDQGQDNNNQSRN